MLNKLKNTIEKLIINSQIFLSYWIIRLTYYIFTYLGHVWVRENLFSILVFYILCIESHVPFMSKLTHKQLVKNTHMESHRAWQLKWQHQLPQPTHYIYVCYVPQPSLSLQHSCEIISVFCCIFVCVCVFISRHLFLNAQILQYLVCQ